MRVPVRTLVLVLFLVTSWLLHARAADAPASDPAPTAPAASADPAADEAAKKKQEAKERFLRGLKLAKEGAWDAALAEFTASRELYPTRVALLNAALSLRQLKRHAEAYATYTELIAKFSGELGPEEKTSAEAARGELRQLVGELDVTSQPPGAMVVVDGVQRGLTPLSEPLLIDAGTHSVRVVKDGFAAHEEQLSVAGRQKKAVTARLKALLRSGTLVIEEADGAALDVLLDGAVVGTTPFSGFVAPGAHSVALRGQGDRGTPPSSALVKEGETLRLVLRAEALDAELRIEPTPSNARVHVDGVAVGAGVWQGKLRAGTHRIEITAEGHVADRRSIEALRGQRSVFSVALERDLSDPMWKAGFVPHLYLEAAGGPALSRSLGGSADAACADAAGSGACREQSRPFGFLVGARAGYELVRGLGLELSFGYTSLAEEQTRTVVASADPEIGTLSSDDYRDTTRLSAPFAALSASYRFLEQTPLTVRVWAGVARANATTTNRGTFRGTYDDGIVTGTVEGPFSVGEAPSHTWAPLIGPELRFGYRLGKRVRVDLGVLALVLVPGDTPRTGNNALGVGSNQDGRRAAAFPNDVSLVGGLRRPTGLVELPREEALGTMLIVAPTLGVGVDL
jgi:hypothetical protein